MISILDALSDPQLFAPMFQPAESWASWRAFLKALFALPMDADEQAIYARHTGRETLPTEAAREAWVCAGRRAGKSRVSALVATYLAAFRDYREFLAPGERATVAVIAADRRQARTVFRYLTGLFEQVPMLRALVERVTAEQVDLRTGVTIEVHTCSFRSTRGYTLAGVVCDEVAYWRDESSANPDTEVLAALRPGLASIPGSLLLAISSPYARRGELWTAYRAHFGRDGDPVLCWQADTRSMNETVPEYIIAEAYEADPARASAEYGALFRTDVESYLPLEVIEAAVYEGFDELRPSSRHVYRAFVDPSGGASDSMTMAVAHAEVRAAGKVAVLDCLREAVPPFSPSDIVYDFAETLRRYGVHTVEGDAYAGQWVAERFKHEKIRYKSAELPKSRIYGEVLAHFNSGTIQLLDVPRLVAQFAGLERKVARGGRDSIDHSPGGRDDLCNAAAGAIWMVSRKATSDQIVCVNW